MKYQKQSLTIFSLLLGSLTTTASYAWVSDDCWLARCDMSYVSSLVGDCKQGPNHAWACTLNPDRAQASAIKNACKKVLYAVCRPNPKTGTYEDAITAGEITLEDVRDCWYNGYLSYGWFPDSAETAPVPDVCSEAVSRHDIVPAQTLCPSFAGTWQVKADGGCDGSVEADVPITYNEDGTWSLGPYGGTWEQNGCHVKMIDMFPEPDVVWHGKQENDNSWSGTFDDGQKTTVTTGCWTATRPSAGAVGSASFSEENNTPYGQ